MLNVWLVVVGIPNIEEVFVPKIFAPIPPGCKKWGNSSKPGEKTVGKHPLRSAGGSKRIRLSLKIMSGWTGLYVLPFP